MKLLTLLKNSVSSLLSILKEPSVPQQVHAKNLSFQAVQTHQEYGPEAESNHQNEADDVARPSKRPRISEPEPARWNATIEINLVGMLHRALGLRESADCQDLSQMVQMNL